MANERDKRYYWLKLNDDFFEDDTMQYLEEQENGKEHALIYLKLLVRSVRTDGILFRLVGENLMPYDEKFLAKITNSTVDTVKVAMDRFKKLGLVDMLGTGEIYMKQIDEMVGSETGHAKQKRLLRARETMSLDCPQNVSEMSHRERVRDRERDKELDEEKDILSSSNEQDSPPKISKHKYGEFNNVLLTDDELEKLKTEYSDWEQRIDKLSIYIGSTGKKYKSHYLTILSWARKEKKPIVAESNEKKDYGW